MKKLLVLFSIVLLLSGCGFFKNIFTSETNTRYYERKARSLVKKLVRQMEEKVEAAEEEAAEAGEVEIPSNVINKIAVLDLTNHTGRVPELGRYISSKIANEISKKNYFTLAAREDLLAVMGRLHLGFSGLDASSLKELGDALHIDAVIAGKITDIGTNLDVNINSIDVKTGEIIASASETITRSDFATEMLRKY